MTTPSESAFTAHPSDLTAEAEHVAIDAARPLVKTSERRPRFTESNLAGKRFGALVIVQLLPCPEGSTRKHVLCRCDCGGESRPRLHVVTSGLCKSCGCGSKNSARNTIHGKSKTPTFWIWAGVIDRCRRKRGASYPDYGGRGIRICERWGLFQNFLDDMGERPPGLSLDRINVNGDYEPSNCRWATPKQQARNTRKTRWIEIDGEVKCLAEWVELSGIPQTTLVGRLRRGVSGAAVIAPQKIRTAPCLVP